ncbi:MAG: hypothetical protein LBQ88_01930 [Treponema sp.]|nr:hypothetical protein [Treponema sp.]
MVHGYFVFLPFLIKSTYTAIRITIPLTLRLSDSFEDTASLGIPAGSPVLELLVKVYNINQGHNEAYC